MTMSSFIEVIETFEIHTLTDKIYQEKINGLLDRFPRFARFWAYDEYRIVMPQKYPKTADDYVSIKFCIIGRFPVYGIYRKRDLELIAICSQGIFFAIDDCDLDPKFVPDVTFLKLYLGIRDSSLAATQTLSYTKTTMCSAISTLSLGYTSRKQNEWADAFVLLMGMTTQAVRISSMKYHVMHGLYEMGDAQNIPCSLDLRVQTLWSKVSKAIRKDEYPYYFKFYDVPDGKLYTGDCELYTGAVENYGNPVLLINDGDRTNGKKFWRRDDDSNGQREGSKTKRKYEKSNGQAAPALGESQKLEVDKIKSIESRGTSESAYPGMSDVFGGTLAAAALGATQKLEVDKIKSIESRGTSEFAYPGMLEVFRRTLAAAVLRARQKLKVDKIKLIELWGTSDSAYPGMSDVFGGTLAAAALGATQKVSASMKDLCFDQFKVSREENDPKRVKGNQEPRQFVQLGCGTISEALGATCVDPLQVIMTRCRSSSIFVFFRYIGNCKK